VFLSKRAVQPASQSLGMEKSELSWILGKVYEVVALRGRLGLLS
jgi:hypothetical protein